jgi:hypothetical protein
VAINVVGWYQTNETSVDIHGNPSQVPTDKALAHVIRTARSLGMKVMLKPMIDLENGEWRGKILPSEKWFQNYTNYIDFFAEFAEQYEVEMFCIGTEYEQTTSWTQQWKRVISGVRSLFNGNLTYAAIWGEFFNVHFWSDLDYAGLDAYYHLSSTNSPTLTEMTAKFECDSINIETWYATNKIPIIFTEIGYLSTDGTNQEPSNYQLQYDMQRKTDLQEQADCYEATFHAVWRKSWLYGMYWWYWQQNPNAGGHDNRDYTPQNKPAQGVLTHWYSLTVEEAEIQMNDYFLPFIIAISLAATLEAAVIFALLKKLRALSKTVPKG